MNGRFGVSRTRIFLFLGFSLALLAAAGAYAARTEFRRSSPRTEALILYNWPDYMPQSLLEGFTAETGIRVDYRTYETIDEAVSKIQDGLDFDVAVMETNRIPELVGGAWLSEIDFRQVPNFKNISANFRELSVDPSNRYTVPFNWGTLGLLVRTDLLDRPVTQWADLWNPDYAGKVTVRAQPRELIAVALKSLGYSINSEDPAHLSQASARLHSLKTGVQVVETATEPAIARFFESEALIMIGWSGDALAAQDRNPNVVYVLPQEGTMIWMENLVVSALSPHREQAYQFINYILRPENTAAFVNHYRYATANEAAYPFIEPKLLNNPIVFPPTASIVNAEWWLPLSPDGNRLWDRTWESFMAVQP